MSEERGNSLPQRKQCRRKLARVESCVGRIFTVEIFLFH